MREGRYFIFFIIAVVLQILANNYLHLPSFITICILPTLITLIPNKVSTPYVLIIAFITAFATDFLASGVLGLTIAALLPVALLRNAFLTVTLGKEAFSRQEDLSVEKHGLWRVSIILILSFLVYFSIFIWIDAAGTQSFLFNGLRLLCSLVSSYLISLLIIKVVAP